MELLQDTQAQIWSPAMYVPALIRKLKKIGSAISGGVSKMINSSDVKEWRVNLLRLKPFCDEMPTVRKHIEDIANKKFQNMELLDGWLIEEEKNSKLVNVFLQHWVFCSSL